METIKDTLKYWLFLFFMFNIFLVYLTPFIFA
ncbi:hypothetical protein [Salinibacter phage M8CC-19]|uniref:Uncharacterized protein n=2 Tax=Kryptosalinivirus M8CC19 TaxID=2560720 RepID=A0A2I6UGB9_9CAUD|nr:hypothetical protein FGG63_gp74 [Salinibacter phage M8CC-19]AUO79029.1 hypothetical protein [Salinibacter phage M8CC-19]AUO79263.1 hypothetical protein [Salinibacter phage M31CC-1]